MSNTPEEAPVQVVGEQDSLEALALRLFNVADNIPQRLDEPPLESFEGMPRYVRDKWIAVAVEARKSEGEEPEVSRVLRSSSKGLTGVPLNPEGLNAAVGGISDLLTMLNINPEEQPEHGGPSVAEVLARAAVSSYFQKMESV